MAGAFGVVTRERENFVAVRELSGKTDYEWQAAWSLRLGAEWQLPSRGAPRAVTNESAARERPPVGEVEPAGVRAESRHGRPDGSSIVRPRSRVAHAGR